MKRFLTADDPCPVCRGFDRAQRGQGVRCYGYLSTDGAYAHCTNDAARGDLAPHVGKGGGETYAHKLAGPCRCGVSHGPAKGGGSVHAIGESARAEIVATYDYVDAQGELRYQTVRKSPKGFTQRRPDGAGGWIWSLQGVERLLYRLPEVIAAVDAGDPVWICEGERDVETLRKQGLAATTNSEGAGKFRAELAEPLRGADVVIVQDKDDPGRAHARDVARKLEGVAKSVRIVEAREGKDATDHVLAGCGLNFLPVWPLESLRESDLAAWKREILRSSFDAGEPFEEHESLEELASRSHSPHWPTGLKRGVGELTHFHGVTIVAGAPGAAKSYLAIASSIDAALYGGWHVLYLSAEMNASLVARRAIAYLDGAWRVPETWKLITVGFGASPESLVELLCRVVTERKTLVVFDSLSSYIDQGQASSRNDPFGMSDLKRTLMWMLNVRKQTEGEVSFLALSELNANGKTKGRFADHKADLVISMETDPVNPMFKDITVVKGWEAAPVGSVGRYVLDWRKATLTQG